MSKITIDRELLEKSIEAMDGVHAGEHHGGIEESIAALQEALAQPQQEPVGEVTDALGDAFKCEFKGPLSVGTKLYTSPPARKPLTAGDRDKVFDRADKRMQSNTNTSWRNAIVDEVEAAHGIKDTQ